MKSVYQCEKCGKLFDDYSVCSDHESEHWIPEINVWNVEKQETEELSELAEYRKDQEEPQVIHVRFQRWANKSSEQEYRYGKYTLVSSYVKPIVLE